MQTTDIITNKSIGMDKERTGMLLLSKEDIKSVITMKDMIEADKQAFKMVVDGTAVSYTHLTLPTKRIV